MNPGRDSSWWYRKCGGRDVVALAWPLVISTASWSLMHFVDRTFLFWYSTESASAALQGGALHWLLVCIPLGLASYVNVFVAQYHGSKRADRIGPAVWQGLWLAAIFAIPFLLLIPFSSTIFAALGHPPAAVALETLYLNALLPSSGPLVAAAALAAFFTGRGNSRVVMLVDLAANCLNALLAYLLIFGKFGLPEWGILGAGVATTLSQWLRMLAFALLMATAHDRRECNVVSLRWNAPLMARMFYFGGSSAIQMQLEVTAFSLFLFFIGKMDSVSSAATTLAFNVNMLAFVPLLGVGNAVSTLVAQQVGENRPDLAARATWTAFLIATVYALLWTIAYALFPDLLLLGYEWGADQLEFSQVRHTIIILLRFVAAYMLFDTMNVVFSHAVKGAGDTRFVLLTSLFTSPLPVVASYYGVTWWGFGLYGCWSAISLWVAILGIVYCLRFIGGKWRTMRVTEATPI